MLIKALGRGRQSFKQHLDGKKRIMTYGAGTLAYDIKKILEDYGYQLNYAIIDEEYCDGNTFIEKKEGGGVIVTPLEKLSPPYNPEFDALIWAIGSPEKLHNCMKDEHISMDCFLIWDLGFWKDKEYFSSHKKDFSEACEMLCDEYSKKVFRDYIEAQKGNIDDDILNCTKETYFNELTRGKRRGAFVDCGSYDGETAIAYTRFIGEECRVYAFEPDKDNYQNLLDKVKDKPNFTCINKGCYSSEKVLSFAARGDGSSSLQEDGDDIVEVTTIDKVVGDGKVAFIKMDVEGAELEALKGAKKVIERDRPILAISAYHRQEDLITLIPYISNLCHSSEKYDLYLRHHGVVQSELVIYAIPRDYEK